MGFRINAQNKFYHKLMILKPFAQSINLMARSKKVIAAQAKQLPYTFSVNWTTS